jgi:hypothetical protein
MATTFFPNDDNGSTIPVLPYRAGGGYGVQLATAAVSVVGPFESGTRIITVRPVGGGVFVQAGAAGVTIAAVPAMPFDGGPHYLGDGQVVDIALGGDTKGGPVDDHLAIYAAAGTPKVYISERG